MHSACYSDISWFGVFIIARAMQHYRTPRGACGNGRRALGGLPAEIWRNKNWDPRQRAGRQTKQEDHRLKKNAGAPPGRGECEFLGLNCKKSWIIYREEKSADLLYESNTIHTNYGHCKRFLDLWDFFCCMKVKALEDYALLKLNVTAWGGCVVVCIIFNGRDVPIQSARLISQLGAY